MYRHVLSRTKRGILELDKQADLVNDDIAEAKKRVRTAAIPPDAAHTPTTPPPRPGLQHAMASKARDKQKQALDSLSARRQRVAAEVESRRRVSQTQVEGARKRLAGLQTLNRRRAERERRRQEIALEVAGDLGAEDEQRLREAFLSKQSYSEMLSEKLSTHSATSAALQRGFQRIKAVTGLTDVDHIVHKYRTRDDTYASLVAQVAAAEDRIEALNRHNEELQKEVEDAREGTPGGPSRQLYKEVDASDQRLEEGRRRRDDLRARSQHATMTLESVRQCVGKLLLLLDPSGAGARRVESIAPAPAPAPGPPGGGGGATPRPDDGAAEQGSARPSSDGTPAPSPPIVRLDAHRGAVAQRPARLVALDGTTAPLPAPEALPAFMDEVSTRVGRLTRLVGEVDPMRGGRGRGNALAEGGAEGADLAPEVTPHNIRVKVRAVQSRARKGVLLREGGAPPCRGRALLTRTPPRLSPRPLQRRPAPPFPQVPAWHRGSTRKGRRPPRSRPERASRARLRRRGGGAGGTDAWCTPIPQAPSARSGGGTAPTGRAVQGPLAGAAPTRPASSKGGRASVPAPPSACGQLTAGWANTLGRGSGGFVPFSPHAARTAAGRGAPTVPAPAPGCGSLVGGASLLASHTVAVLLVPRVGRLHVHT